MKKLGSYFGIIKEFIYGSYLEFRKVSWPSKNKTIRLTVYVIGVSLGVAVFVWVADIVIQKVLSTIIIK